MSPLRLYLSFFAGTVIVASGVRYWARAHRRTPEQLEYERRQRLKTLGRMTDGTLLDVQEAPANNGLPVQLLVYTYDIGGVSYECSQDVTHLQPLLNLQSCRLGLPASIKYDPHNPGNSIVVAEGWTGLRL
jgi:hypothetical protein